jgi:hypothetical protein
MTCTSSTIPGRDKGHHMVVEFAYKFTTTPTLVEERRHLAPLHSFCVRKMVIISNFFLSKILYTRSLPRGVCIIIDLAIFR